jgi:hypothetical protein
MLQGVCGMHYHTLPLPAFLTGDCRLYDARKPLEPVFPSVHPSRAEQFADAASDVRDKRVLEHAPPG